MFQKGSTRLFQPAADLVFFFRTRDLPFTPATTEAMLMAHGAYTGGMIHIMGMDSVVVKP